MQFVFHTAQAKRYRFPTHTNDLVVDRAASQTSEVFLVTLNPGEAPPLHKHDDAEQVFYILEGEGTLRTGADEGLHPVQPGDVVRIPPTIFHSIQCTGKQPLKYLAIDCFVGGRPDHEPTWDAHVKVLCQQHGWDYESVVESAPAKKAAPKKRR